MTSNAFAAHLIHRTDNRRALHAAARIGTGGMRGTAFLAVAGPVIVAIRVAAAGHGCLIAFDRCEFSLLGNDARQGRIEQSNGGRLARGYFDIRGNDFPRRCQGASGAIVKRESLYVARFQRIIELDRNQVC